MSIAQPIPLDARGQRRSPASIKGHTPLRAPANKGRQYPPDPLPVEDIVALLGACTAQRPGPVGELSAARLRALIIVLWRTGMRISEALALSESDLNHRDLMIVIRRGKGGKRRLVMMDAWGWSELEQWLELRAALPPGEVFCVVHGPTAGRGMLASQVRRQLRDTARRAGLRRRTPAHGFRHTHAVELWREGHDVYTLQTQLGHAHLDVTAAYLRGVAVTEVLEPIGRRKPPMMIIPSG
jgi:integrase